MRNKIIYIVLCIFGLAPVYATAQSLGLAKQYLTEKQLAAAKEQIDVYVDGEGSTDATGWLLKATIYTAIGNDAQWKYLVPDGRMEALNSLKRASVLNKELVTAELEKSNFKPLLDIYRGYTADGIATFNTATETKLAIGYTKALDLFKNALIVNDLVQQQGWQVTLQPGLQSLQYNATQTAINAGNEDVAILYSRQLADAGVISTGNYTKADFANIYQWLVNYYHIKQDSKNLQFYAEWSAKNYPDSPYFATVLINSYRKSAEYNKLLEVYDRVLPQFPTQHQLLYNYCADLFTYIYTISTSKEIKAELHPKLEQQLKDYINQQPDSAKGHLLLGKHYFNKAVDLQKSGTKAASIVPYLNQAIAHLKSGVAKCNGCDRAMLKEAQLTMCTALRVTGRKDEADACNKKLMEY